MEPGPKNRFDPQSIGLVVFFVSLIVVVAALLVVPAVF